MGHAGAPVDRVEDNMGGGQDTPMNSAAEPDDTEDDMLELPGDDGDRSANALSMLLMLVGMICIPLGLVFVFLAFTRGDNARQATVAPRTVVPEFAPGIDALAGRYLIVGGENSWISYRGTTPTSGGTTPTREFKTFSIDGGIVIVGTSVTAGEVTGVALNADLTQLRSGDAAVDEGLKTTGLETNAFPNAEFFIPATDPIVIPRVPAFGDHLEIAAKGQLTLHGVTKTVDVKLTAQLIQGDPVLIELVGTMPIDTADFGIAASARGEVTFHLRMARVPDEVAGQDPHAGTTARTTPTPAGSAPRGSTPGTAKP
jgi:polyisoprenoid-binding protein YceI